MSSRDQWPSWKTSLRDIPAEPLRDSPEPSSDPERSAVAGLSPATVTRLTRQWQEDHAAFQDRDLSQTDYVHVRADGVHPKVRLGKAHSCVPVLLGVRPDDSKELIALARARASPPSRGPTCCATAHDAPCTTWNWSPDGATGLSNALAEGSPLPATSAAGSTSSAISRNRAEVGPAGRDEGDTEDLQG
ncbi:transposase [Streptomyces sp. NPDC005648]|uniref:transposase n=1 Tax=Streptomyces sp. NPDC005648 TaxID=3157044 RepID=UPI0033A6C3B2